MVGARYGRLTQRATLCILAPSVMGSMLRLFLRNLSYQTPAERRQAIQTSPLLADPALHSEASALLPPRAAASLADLLAHLRAWE